jgi:hypothetical protein
VCSVTMADSEGAKSASEQLTIVVTPGDSAWRVKPLYLNHCAAGTNLHQMLQQVVGTSVT